MKKLALGILAVGLFANNGFASSSLMSSDLRRVHMISDGTFIRGSLASIYFAIAFLVL